VSDKERAQQQAALFRDVAGLVADMCINPESQRPYPLSVVERALHDVHFAVQPNKAAKAQALKAVERLKTAIPIARARMRVRIAVPEAGAGAAVAAAAEEEEEEEGAGSTQMRGWEWHWAVASLKQMPLITSEGAGTTPARAACRRGGWGQ
jgi:ribosome maturation protein SDO1